MRLSELELYNILILHSRWLAGHKDGHRADLRGADLSNADLSSVNLSYADLRGADLSNADLTNAVMQYAELRDANMSFSDLRHAIMNNVDFSCANLSHSNLSYADLSGSCLRDSDIRWASLRFTNLRFANLNNTDLSNADLGDAYIKYADFSDAILLNTKNMKRLVPLACPETGSFIGWKKCDNNTLVKLLIPKNAKRSSATGRKCRCDRAKVLGIYEIKHSATGEHYANKSELIVRNSLEKTHSIFNPGFAYELGEWVQVPDFDEDRFRECAPGIHFFITIEEAISYTG